MSNRDRQNMNTLADKLAAVAAEMPAQDRKTVLDIVAASPTAPPVDIFAPQNEIGDSLTDAAQAGGLSVNQLFSGVVFRAVDKDVYKSEDGIRFSRKVADCMIELAHSGLYIPGSISQVQNLKDAEAHYEMAFLYSRQSRRSAIVVNDRGTVGKDLKAWKDQTIEAYEVWRDANGITAENPVKTEHKHIVKGVSLIGSV